MSPTQRSLALLRKRGLLAAVVERWNPHARIRQDLFGIVDVVAIGEGETVAVQATSGSNVAARLAKMRASPALARILAAGWRVEVHGWRRLKSSRRWEARIVVVEASGGAYAQL